MTDAAEHGRARAVMRQRSLRAANLGLVMETIAAGAQPSRAEIAATTGMTRSTISRLVDDLVGGGLAHELAPIGGQRGRPATPLVPASGTIVALGCEIGVDRVVVRAIDLSGEVLVHEDRTLDDNDPHHVHEVLAGLVRQAQIAMAGARVVGVGLAVPGLVDGHTGEILRAPNLGWQGVWPERVLADLGVHWAGLRFLVVNEADAAAISVAELSPGRPSGREEFLYVSGEIGIGSAAVFRGRVAGGARGWGGELGHLCIDLDGPRCRCGASGCLETRAGRPAVLRAAGASDTADLLRRLSADDPVARSAVREAGRALGVAVAGALNLLDLTEVVLGGFLADIGESLIDPIMSEVRERVLSSPIAPATVSIEDGGEWRAATGAAHSVLAGVIGDPAGWLDAGGSDVV